MVHRLRNPILLAMMVGNSNFLFAAGCSAQSQDNYTLGIVKTRYKYKYTEQECENLRYRVSSAPTEIHITLTELFHDNQSTEIFFGKDNNFWHGDPKSPKYWPNGYYTLAYNETLKKNEPQLQCDFVGNYWKDQDDDSKQPNQWNAKLIFCGLFPSLLTLGGGYYLKKSAEWAAIVGVSFGAAVFFAASRYITDKTGPGYDRNDTNAPRFGMYSFNDAEVTHIKDDLKGRVTGQHPVIVQRVHQIVDQVVNTNTQYPVVYSSSDYQWVPSRDVGNYDERREKVTDIDWIKDGLVEFIGTRMAKLKFEQEEMAYKSLRVGGVIGGAFAGCCALGKYMLAQHAKNS